MTCTAGADVGPTSRSITGPTGLTDPTVGATGSSLAEVELASEADAVNGFGSVTMAGAGLADGFGVVGAPATE